MKPFNIDTVPLETGATLIEASAGTGKTYSIAGLFLRLVMEQHVPIQKILALTYTDAATQELRDRIRKRLREKLAELKAEAAGGPPSPAIRELDLAVQSFDEAQIFTIHGFCQRALRDHAFESGTRYEAELVTDPLPLIEEVAQDFWRQTFYEASPFLAALALTRGFSNAQSPAPLIDLIQRTRNHPDLCILPGPDSESCAVIASKLAAAFELIRTEWAESQEQIERILRESPALSRNKSKAFGEDKVEELLKSLGKLSLAEDQRSVPYQPGAAPQETQKNISGLKARAIPQERPSRGPSALDSFESETWGDAPGWYEAAPLALTQRGRDAHVPLIAPDSLDALSWLCSSFLAENTLKKQVTPQHRFFDLCEEFCEAATRYFRQLTHEALDYAKSQMAERKLHRNILHFDDLLTRLHTALRSEHGAALVTSLGGKFQAALIDEFQDTDPLQYSIFRRLFGAGDHWLYFIGDPKQAIYGFRGADVFTYFSAREDTTSERQYTLEVNWRSDKLLLDGYNALFEKTGAFVDDKIKYLPVQVRPKAPAPPMPGPQLNFRYIASRNEDGSAHTKEQAQELITQTVAADLAGLHRSGPFRWQDLAVLVRTHRQAGAVQKALRELGIRSVLQTDESVLHTDDACDLQRVLDAVIDPRNDSKLKAALCTRLLGCDAAALAALNTDEPLRQRWLERFFNWRHLWENGCFIAMFRRLMTEAGVRQRLVESTGGERRLTNVLHLSELLHSEETGRRLTPEALCDWLREQRHDDGSSSDAAQLRLESDGDAVTIVTVHKSKGLEYPVVFCPFLWIPFDSRYRQSVQFHDEMGRLTIDLRGKKGAPEEYVEKHTKEVAAEDARLLYVAVTRAKHRCVIYGGDFKETAGSTLTHMLGTGELRSGMESLAAAHPESVSFSLLSANGATPYQPGASPQVFDSEPSRAEGPHHLPVARRFGGSLPKTAFITSFSGLTAGTTSEEPERDRPAEAPQIVPPAPTNEDFGGIFRFEKGARAGDFFHDVLEHLDFQNPAELDDLIRRKLTVHGFAGTSATMVDALKAKLVEVLDIELADGLQLKQIAKAQRLSEVEFAFRLNSLCPEDLGALFSGHATPALDPHELSRLRFSPVDGFLRGFIDLIFEHHGRYYVLDWKSNWLGNAPENYDLPGVQASMRHHHYALQAHLYVLAADRFLAARLPDYNYEQHFGGVFYLFLRGVERDNPERGIYRVRPTLELIEAMRGLTMSQL